MFPVACPACLRRIGRHWSAYEAKLASGTTPFDAMNDLGVLQLCCRTQFLTYADTFDEVCANSTPAPPPEAAFQGDPMQ